MKIVSAAWFVLVAQLALLPFEVTASCTDREDEFASRGDSPIRNWCDWVRKKFQNEADHPIQCSVKKLTDHCPQLCKKRECGFPCADRTESFKLNPNNPNDIDRDWCIWIPIKYPNPADQARQCRRLKLTDHCPVLCQKQECVATAAPVPAPGPGGNANALDLEILKQKVDQMALGQAQLQAQLEADVLKIVTAIGDLSSFVMRPDEPSAAPSDVPSVEASSTPSNLASPAPSAFETATPSTACQVPNPEFVGDGMCDGGDYNTDLCNYDGGDCLEFNEKYPGCNVPDPTKVGDGFCDDQHLSTPVYNVAECKNDGGDCASS